MKRRTFIKSAAGIGIAGAMGPLNASPLQAAEPQETSADLRRRIAESLAGIDAPIESITYYGVHVDAERRFSWGVQEHRQHAFLRFEAGGESGWSEVNLGYEPKHQEIPLSERIKPLDWYQELCGKTVGEALLNMSKFGAKRHYATREYVEIALLDLAGRLTGESAIELLGLRRNEAVPGVYCVLNDDAEVVRREAARAISQKMHTHLKVKLYGKLDTDLAVTEAAREIIGPQAYLIGDVNYGYRRKTSDKPLDSIAEALKSLHGVGLTACEDPAGLSVDQWCEMQQLVGDLDLLPDKPLRPAAEAIGLIKPEMGRVFNMHPACMGSMIDTVVLGRKILGWGKRLMVGDASLVGPGCHAWQNLAIGIGADWVEAVEKPQENDVFQRCLLRQAIGRTPEGMIIIKDHAPGFGAVIDTARINSLAYATEQRA